MEYDFVKRKEFTGTYGGIPTSCQHFWINGNTINGDVGSTPSTIMTLVVYGTGNPSGNFAFMYLPNLTRFEITATGHTIGGAIGSLPSSLTFFKLTGGGADISYSTHTWGNPTTHVYINGDSAAYSLTSTEVDNLLINLAAATWDVYSGYGSVWLAGNNGARTSASNAAVTTLQGKGVTVTTN